MSFPKNKASGTADALKVDDRNASLDTLIRQTSGKDTLHNFTLANESPAQFIQLLNALDQEGAAGLGWPLCSPLKIQMQKCDKCSCEFCSTINYRRHMRLHRRNLNLDKDSTKKTRDLLQVFWDKRRPEEAMKIMSFNDVALEGVSGYAVLKALASFTEKPGFSSLPPSYATSGSALLDIVQGSPSRFPLSSHELFSILDDASEKTFLCAGTAESLMKYVFDGEAKKVGLEMKNLVACTSFLVELKLVKACFVDKDAEALRYQKLLVEEEAAAQKRQAALLEKKRLKKLRQKEHRAKEQASAERDDSPEDRSLSPPTSSSFDTPDSILEVLEVPHNGTLSFEPVPPTSSSFDIPDSILEVLEVPHNETLSSEPVPPTSSSFDTPDSIEVPEVPHNGTLFSEPVQNEYSDFDTSLNVYPDSGNYQNVENRTSHQSARRPTVNSRWQEPKLQKTPNVFNTSNNHQAPKLGTTQKRASSRDSHIAVSNGAKVWTQKPKSDTDEESCKTRLQIEAPNHDVSNSVKVWTPKPKSDTDEESCKTRLQIEAPNLAVSNGVRVWTPKPKSDTDEESCKTRLQIEATNLAVSNGVKVWTPKPRSDTDEESCKTRLQFEAPNLDEQDKEHEVLIGSMSVTLGNRTDMQQGGHLVRAPESSSPKLSTRDVNGRHARPVKIEVIQGTANRSTVKLWRPNQNGIGACVENHAYTESSSRFSSHAAEAFLANRWKEAITSKHVKLVLSDKELDENQGAAPLSEVDQRGILRSAEGYTNLEHVAAVKSKVRGKAVKGSKVQYIPKQSGYN